jgi:acyl dehydratase
MRTTCDAGENNIIFSEHDCEAFRKVSGDSNPLQVSPDYASKTPYGQPVVFGALGVIACLGKISLNPASQIVRLDADFLRPMFTSSIRTESRGPFNISKAKEIAIAANKPACR